MLRCAGMRTSAPRALAPAGSPEGAEILATIRPVDALLARVARSARVLHALVPTNATSERARLVAEVARGEAPTPRWELGRRRAEPGSWRAIDRARGMLEARIPRPLRDAYLARIDELELDLAMIEAAGDPIRVRPLAARRYGTGMREVPLEDGPVRVHQVARGLLERLPPEEETRTVGADVLATKVREAARAAGLGALEVKVEPRLAAGAATGDRSVFLAARRFGSVEARRIVVHEILGHAVAAANAATQALRIFEIGTAGSFADQEGVAICLEEQAGVLDVPRMRVLAARVLATDRLHTGASFGEIARALHRQHGFSPQSAVAIAERAHRGGGIARDACYLYGYLRVRGAIRRGSASVDALRVGRVGLDDLPLLEMLRPLGLAHEATHRPRLDRVLALL